MEKLTKLVSTIAWINVIFFALFVFLLFASINCKDFKEAQKQGEKYIFFLSIVAILLDIIWIIIGLFADVSINGPIVLIVFWIFMII